MANTKTTKCILTLNSEISIIGQRNCETDCGLNRGIQQNTTIMTTCKTMFIM